MNYPVRYYLLQHVLWALQRYCTCAGVKGSPSEPSTRARSPTTDPLGGRTSSTCTSKQWNRHNRRTAMKHHRHTARVPSFNPSPWEALLCIISLQYTNMVSIMYQNATLDFSIFIFAFSRHPFLFFFDIPRTQRDYCTSMAP